MKTKAELAAWERDLTARGRELNLLENGGPVPIPFLQECLAFEFQKIAQEFDEDFTDDENKITNAEAVHAFLESCAYKLGEYPLSQEALDDYVAYKAKSDAEQAEFDRERREYEEKYGRN